MCTIVNLTTDHFIEPDRSILIIPHTSEHPRLCHNQGRGTRAILNTRFSANRAKEIPTKPVYTGIGPYPPIVEFELWLDANVRMIEEDGAEIVIHGILGQFKKEPPDLGTPDAKPYISQAQLNPRAALIRLLNDLRQLVQQATRAGENEH